MSAWRPPAQASRVERVIARRTRTLAYSRATELHSLLAARPLVSSYSLYSLLAHRRRWDKCHSDNRILRGRRLYLKKTRARTRAASSVCVNVPLQSDVTGASLINRIYPLAAFGSDRLCFCNRPIFRQPTCTTIRGTDIVAGPGKSSVTGSCLSVRASRRCVRTV
ncbi:hypothetical protein MSG28_015488 [Choristoneura fumiferana]|uniref:Uncharacterized protein n=1 Tax=Choristoneura fumiferana TaxID=7141 RepID=A0ACC0KAF7_CHOFU|nr:hypothetical protein MSG28_015488 [Choristoneura fumiferana]